MIYRTLLVVLFSFNFLSSQTLCENGFAGNYPCNNTHLLSHVSVSDLNGGSPTNLNDIWGWTDPASAQEFALVGMSSGTAFVNITDPLNPVVIGKLPTHTTNSSWRDIKVYQGHAYIGSEASGHGMQIFDLSQLVDPPAGYQTFTNTAHYAGFGKSHNIVLNEESGYVYGVGSSASFSGGLHAVNISDPTFPVLAGGFSDDGYTHDAQVVNYTGPDTEHLGKEIAFACNANTLTIVDVDDKTDMSALSISTYEGEHYTHQGWLTEDHKYFIMGDELDELQSAVKTTTFIWDVQDLDSPTLLGTYVSDNTAIDHNQYIKGDWCYQANYSSGLRILSIENLPDTLLEEVAYFDTYPSNDNANFNGVWSNYPFFESNNVVLSDIGSGLFVVRPVFSEIQLISDPCPGQDLNYTLQVKRGLNGPISITVNDLPSGASYTLDNSAPVEGDVVNMTISGLDQVATGNYEFEVVFSDGTVDHSEKVDLQVVPSLPEPVGLSSSFGPNSVLLTWDPVPSTIACKIRGRELGTNAFANTPIFYADEPYERSVWLGILEPNTTYEWQVICGCSVTPVVATPWSAFATFTTPPSIQVDNESTEEWLTEDNKFVIFPNPASEEIFISSEKAIEMLSVEILSTKGEKVFSDNQMNENSLRINIGHLRPGIYFVILSEGSAISTHKLIVD